MNFHDTLTVFITGFAVEMFRFVDFRNGILYIRVRLRFVRILNEKFSHDFFLIEILTPSF